jgi:hypothetical protein
MYLQITSLSRACGASFCSEVLHNCRTVLGDQLGACGGDYVALGGLWPGDAAKQSELDAIGCDICQDPGGLDNMVICSGCSRCFHLRCIMPPLSTVPSGDWYCPGLVAILCIAINWQSCVTQNLPWCML